MNKVHVNKECKVAKWNISELTDLLSAGVTAFVGRVDDFEQKENDLFLIVFDIIVLAKDPSATWDDPSLSFIVKNFVDVDISVANVIECDR